MSHFVGMKHMLETRYGTEPRDIDLNEDVAHARKAGRIEKQSWSLSSMVDLLRARIVRSRERRHLALGLERLANTSPHLLADIGVGADLDVEGQRETGKREVRETGVAKYGPGVTLPIAAE
jgi:hypothetical protein